MTPSLLRRFGYGLLLAAYLAYTAFFAPKGDPPGVSFLSLARGLGPGVTRPSGASFSCSASFP